MLRKFSSLSTLLLLALTGGVSAAGDGVPSGDPQAVIDLATREGVDTVRGSWRYSDVEIVEIDFLEAGPDGQPGTRANRAYDLRPHAGRAEFDDSAWAEIDPTTLDRRRTAGRLSFNWYRIEITVPERIGGYDPAGSTVVFETSIDDYAEIWVDGELSRPFGQTGGPVVAGWNAPNRLVVGRNVRPGQRIQLAVFGINGPISQSPTNYIFMRYARLEFYPGPWEPVAVEPHEVNVLVERLDPALDRIVPRNPKLFKLAEGFAFTEGPVWVRDGGYLLFSDPNQNRIYRYGPGNRLSVHREQSGYAGDDVSRYGQPGSNGLTIDAQGRLATAEHGRRRISRTEKDGRVVTLVDRFEGRRLNSPNDLVYKSDGTLYFTDPPFGLPGFEDDPAKELSFNAVFRLDPGGRVEPVAKDLVGPNGLAFSPDERFLYVANWDPARKVVMRYPVRSDGSLGDGEVFFDMTDSPEEEALDGVKVDETGNLFVSGPGGIWILSPGGKHLGTVKCPQPAHNFAWGGDEGSDLYIMARSKIYRMPLLVRGVRP
jgi:gluconolactonase